MAYLGVDGQRDRAAAEAGVLHGSQVARDVDVNRLSLAQSRRNRSIDLLVCVLQAFDFHLRSL